MKFKSVQLVIAILAACTLLSSCSFQRYSPETAVHLIDTDFSNWQNKGKWQTASQASQHPQNRKQISTKPGSGIIFNGPDGSADDLITKAEFGDVKAHIEFMLPEGSNSGVYLQGRYEIQILDSWGVEKPGYGDCGGIYERWDENRDHPGYEGYPPKTNASKKPGQWQTFDIIFKAPRFDKNGKKIQNAEFVQIVHNGILIHENQQLSGPTRGAYLEYEGSKGPLRLQGDHGPIAYRNIMLWPLNK